MLLGIAATINVMAIDYTAKAIVKLESQSGYSCYLTLRQADSYGALGGAEMYMSGLQVAMYALNGATPLEIAQAADFTNVAVGLKTDASTSYTITVSGVAGNETLVLYDLLYDEQYPLTEGAEYENIPAAANSVINDRFVINYVPAPSCTTVRSGLNVDQYYTICLPQQIASANASFWSMSKRGEGVAYLEEAAFPLTAGQPYIFQAEESTLCVVYGNAVPAAEAGAAGVLVGTFDPMAQNELSQAAADYNSPIYLLYNNELRPAAGAGNNLPANRAFIVYNNFIVENPAPAPGRRVRAIPMQTNGATAFENVDVEAAKAVKFMEDGKIFIKRGDAIYNLQGQLVK